MANPNRTIRTHLDLSDRQVSAIETDVDLDALLSVTTLRNVQTPEGMTPAEAMRFHAPREAVARTRGAWDRARSEGRSAETVEEARAAFVAALLACGVPTKVSL
jgi:hypothetical protein